ncbi:prepilin-type N-terminal cleavage/methylation domain-containing protein [Sulfurovum sp. zt1-1]|uniref:Prepilin-type N-terminal cleavage/methylation domain-containing protein n=1 Tax=Sulfurovum zhangzhouensis TaxID=3019067 RepID=A0ABT7QWN0_9BACT|nr:prepilin-type N-terminal cleavage/methylation domain-containing protein [Sulfurovum zhangzhouensis]MDM5271238.1 prepilin-type N-terminal cleavage/methylation domain-containing protein [Sulfurovum zhangzhouensis]
MKHFNQKSNTTHAFTMLELVVVIVVLGILAAMAMPRMERDTQQEAADHILSKIRYTQHLALNDYKQRFDDHRWQRRFWRIIFSSCSGGDQYYMIGSDDDMSGSDNAYFSENEAAIDPITGKPIFWENTRSCSNGGDGTVSEDIFLTYKFGITNVTNSCGAEHIAFDHLGRPYHGATFSNANAVDYEGYLDQRCTFTFTLSDGNTFQISVEPETGYAYIEGQNAS